MRSERALEVYKQAFGDYPRINYQATPPNYNGIGSGASVLGKALLGLGDSVSKPYAAGNTYYPGQIVSYSGGSGTFDYAALQPVPAGTAPAEPANAFWAPIPLITAADGADGPGFRVRGTQGTVYGPYLDADKFKTIGLAIVDSFGNPILYYPANPSKPVFTVDGTTLTPRRCLRLWKYLRRHRGRSDRVRRTFNADRPVPIVLQLF